MTALEISNVDSGAQEVVVAKLNRPEVRNAIDETMVADLHELCDQLERDPKILIITGCIAETSKGPRGIFASGADIAQLKERRREDALRGINNTIFTRIANLPAPVIAAVDGFALGGGLELALAADFRVATPKAKFGQPEANLGIVAAAGALWRLKACVGLPLAREILMAGKIIDGAQAHEAQLVNELAEPDNLLAQAHDLATRIAQLDPLAVRMTKQLLAMPESAHPMVDNIAQAVLFESPAKFDRMQAFLDKKKGK